MDSVLGHLGDTRVMHLMLDHVVGVEQEVVLVFVAVAERVPSSLFPDASGEGIHESNFTGEHSGLPHSNIEYAAFV